MNEDSVEGLLDQFRSKLRGTPLTDHQKERIINPYSKNLAAYLKPEEMKEAIDTVMNINENAIYGAMKRLSEK